MTYILVSRDRKLGQAHLKMGQPNFKWPTSWYLKIGSWAKPILRWAMGHRKLGQAHLKMGYPTSDRKLGQAHLKMGQDRKLGCNIYIYIYIYIYISKVLGWLRIGVDAFHHLFSVTLRVLFFLSVEALWQAGTENDGGVTAATQQDEGQVDIKRKSYLHAVTDGPGKHTAAKQRCNRPTKYSKWAIIQYSVFHWLHLGHAK